MLMESWLHWKSFVSKRCTSKIHNHSLESTDKLSEFKNLEEQMDCDSGTLVLGGNKSNFLFYLERHKDKSGITWEMVNKQIG